MSNKKNLPNIPIYIGDWERDCNVLSLESEAAWMRILFKLWTKGKQNSIKIPTKSLQNLWRCSGEKMNEILNDLIYNEIAEISISTGFVEFTCRRFVKENAISEIRSKASKGVKSSNKSQTKAKQKPNKNEQNSENDNDYVNEIEVKDEIEISNKNPKIEFQKIVDIFNSVCRNLPTVQKLTTARESAINARINDYGLSKIGEVFQLVSSNEFLNGNNDRGWKADFDWIMNPNNFIKILEGKYQNNGKQINNNQGASDDFRAKTAQRLGVIQP